MVDWTICAKLAKLSGPAADGRIEAGSWGLPHYHHFHPPPFRGDVPVLVIHVDAIDME
jgi:hypothetical protein